MRFNRALLLLIGCKCGRSKTVKCFCSLPSWKSINKNTRFSENVCGSSAAAFSASAYHTLPSSKQNKLFDRKVSVKPIIRSSSRLHSDSGGYGREPRSQEDVEGELYSLLGREVKLKSAVQINQLLYKDLECKPPEWAVSVKTGKASTDKTALSAMLDSGELNDLQDTAIRLIMEWRSLKNKTRKEGEEQEHAGGKSEPGKSTSTKDQTTYSGRGEWLGVPPRGPVTYRNAPLPKNITSSFSDDEGEEVSAVPSGPEQVVIFDAYYIITRMFHIVPRLVAPSGEPIGAIQGLCNTINKVVLNPIVQSPGGRHPKVVFAFDTGGKTFRHEIEKMYKAQRPATDDDLIPQFQIAREAVDAYGFQSFEAEGFEADDVIATLVSGIGSGPLSNYTATIVSNDKDLMQLVSDKVKLLEPKNMKITGPDEVMAKWGVTPSQLGDLLALTGDVSDNLPGVPGVGPKKAMALIQKYGTLQSVLDTAVACEKATELNIPLPADPMPKSKQRTQLASHVQEALLTRRLVELVNNVPLPGVKEGSVPLECLSRISLDKLDHHRLTAFFRKYGLDDLEKRTNYIFKSL